MATSFFIYSANPKILKNFLLIACPHSIFKLVADYQTMMGKTFFAIKHADETNSPWDENKLKHLILLYFLALLFFSLFII